MVTLSNPNGEFYFDSAAGCWFCSRGHIPGMLGSNNASYRVPNTYAVTLMEEAVASGVDKATFSCGKKKVVKAVKRRATSAPKNFKRFDVGSLMTDFNLEF